MARYQIKRLVARQGFTLRRLAAETGLSEPRLRAIANNRVENVTVRTLEVIAATLQVPLGEVFEPASLEAIPTLAPDERLAD